MHKIYEYLLTIIILLSLFGNTFAQNIEIEEDTRDTTATISENTLRFGLSYSLFNFLFFGNDHKKDNMNVSFRNISPNLDYYINQNTFLSLKLGYDFYRYGGDDYLYYHEHIDNFYVNLLFSKYLTDIYYGIGLGFSYTYHICEYEYEMYQYIPIIGETLYIGNKYYLFEQRNSSLDLAFQIGTEFLDYINFGLDFKIALLNLRDQTNDFTHKATMGITIGLKYPKYKK